METIINGTSLTTLEWAAKQALEKIKTHGEQTPKKGAFKVYLQILKNSFPYICRDIGDNLSPCQKRCALSLIQSDIEDLLRVFEKLKENQKGDAD